MINEPPCGIASWSCSPGSWRGLEPATRSANDGGDRRSGFELDLDIPPKCRAKELVSNIRWHVPRRFRRMQRRRRRESPGACGSIAPLLSGRRQGRPAYSSGFGLHRRTDSGGVNRFEISDDHGEAGCLKSLREPAGSTPRASFSARAAVAFGLPLVGDVSLKKEARIFHGRSRRPEAISGAHQTRSESLVSIVLCCKPWTPTRGRLIGRLSALP